MRLLNFGVRSAADAEWNVEERLKGIEIFSKLTDKQIRTLARVFLPRRYAKGDVIIRKGDTGLGMFLIMNGALEVYDERDGKRATLATLRPGHSVGEMSLLDGRPRSANVEAIEDSECVLMTRDSFNSLTRRDPEILWGIVPQLVERLREANERLARTDDRRPVAATPEVVAETRAETAAEPVVVVSSAASAPADAPRQVSGDPVRSRTSRPADENDDVDDDVDTDKPDDNTMVSGLVQLSSASVMLWTSVWVLGAQESLRLVRGRESVGNSLSESEKVVSTLTAKYEEQMNDQSKQLFRAVQEFIGAAASMLQR